MRTSPSTTLPRLLLPAFVLLLVPVMPATTRAETFATCTGFITSLPATITTQGTWCLQGDLATTMSSGTAISIQTSNVTIDCNGFKLGGLAAGIDTHLTGIHASGRHNITVRHCALRGFLYGVSLAGADQGGHLVHDNRFDGITCMAVRAGGDGTEVRGNRIIDTGDTPTGNVAIGIRIENGADAIGNLITGVAAGTSSSGGHAYGISVSGYGVVQGNRIRDVLPYGTGNVAGIVAQPATGRIRLVDNQVFGNDLPDSIGMNCAFNGRVSMRGNFVADFATPWSYCSNDGSDNVSK